MPHVISFVGSSGSGKTSLVIEIVQILSSQGKRVGTVKHAHHNVEMDTPGKDSHRHFAASGIASLLVSGDRIWLTRKIDTIDLAAYIERYFFDCDIVVVEGFKNDDTPKIEVYRQETGKAPLYRNLRNVRAVATDAHLSDITCLDINDPAAIVRFIELHMLSENLPLERQL